MTRQDPKLAATECLGAFYEVGVRWIRGLHEFHALKKQWNEQVAPRTFTLLDGRGKLWRGDAWLVGHWTYGCGASWSTFDVELRNLQILQQHDVTDHRSLILAVVEVWQCRCINDVSGEEITARKVTAWIQHDRQAGSIASAAATTTLLHIHECYIEGQGPAKMGKSMNKGSGRNDNTNDNTNSMNSNSMNSNSNSNSNANEDNRQNQEMAAAVAKLENVILADQADLKMPKSQNQAAAKPEYQRPMSSWRQTNIASKRRHISERLEQFHAKPLLWDHQLVGISIHGWDIGTSQGPIGREGWFEQATNDLEALSQHQPLQSVAQSAESPITRRIGLPEMVFPAAHVALERTKGDFFISWDAMDALKEWGEAHQAIPIPNDEDGEKSSPASFRGVSVLKVSDAKLWQNKTQPLATQRATTTAISKTSAIFHYDWSFSTPFCGKLFGAQWTSLPQSGMPVHLLTDQSVPILLFDDIVLYEDDLHDNGEVQMTVKMRVMPTCIYVLSKLFCRIDHVLVRVRECRTLVAFAQHKLYRDVTWRECAWKDLRKHQLPGDLNSWTPTDLTKDTPAFLHLLTKIPTVSLPDGIHAHAEMVLPK